MEPEPEQCTNVVMYPPGEGETAASDKALRLSLVEVVEIVCAAGGMEERGISGEWIIRFDDGTPDTFTVTLGDALDLDDVVGVDDPDERAEINEMLSAALAAADGGAAAGLPDGVTTSDVCSEAEPGEEQAALAAFRAQAEEKFGMESIVTLTVPHGPDYVDTTLLRFLRARLGDQAKALEMVEQCLELRKREQIDTILERPLPKVVREHLHSCYDEGWLPSPDKSGRPVYILVGGRTGERLGKLFSPPEEGMPWELPDVMEAFLHWHLQMMEYLNKVVYAKLSARAGRLVNKFVMIDDLSGMSTQGVTQIMKFVDIMKKMAEIDQLLYPEGLGCMYFCNAPWIFSAPWKVISSFMTEETAKRMHVVSAEDTPKVLKDCMDEEALPEFLGGSLQGDYVSGEAITTTPWHDEADAYIDLQAAKAIPFPWPAAETIVVGARDASTAVIEIAAGETARWEWDIEAYDVGFKAVFTKGAEDGGEAVVVSAEERCEAGLARFRGEYSPAGGSGGTLELSWDNAHSMMRSKSVRYRGAAAVVVEEAEPQSAITAATAAQ
jgi:hypothetical protein